MSTQVTKVEKAPRLSQQLKAVAERCATATVTIGELTSTLKGSPYLLLTAILSLPFLTPIPMLGLSTPFGILIAIFGVRLMFGQEPRVPANIMALTVPQKFFPSLLKATSGLLRGIEVFSKPRWRWMTSRGILMNFYGLLILLSALMLLPPLPIPFSNFFPALTLFLLSIGLIERDGAFILWGILAFIVTVAFFALIIFGGQEIFHIMWDAVKTWATGGYAPEPAQ